VVGNFHMRVIAQRAERSKRSVPQIGATPETRSQLVRRMGGEYPIEK
jgi:hypothetical protein